MPDGNANNANGTLAAGDDELRCVSAGLLHNSPRPVDAAGLSPGHLHCQREYDHHHAQYSTRPSGLGDGEGRISLNNFVAFPYLDAVGPDDGGACDAACMDVRGHISLSLTGCNQPIDTYGHGPRRSRHQTTG